VRNWTLWLALFKKVGRVMATTPDRRVRRTRKALQDALIGLMTEKGYEAVTVQDIIERADVGRSTFYMHYTDKDELLRDNFARLRSLVEQPAPLEPANRRRLLRFSLPLFRHVHAERSLARALFGRPGGGPVLRQVEQMLADIVRAELAELFATDPPSRAPEDAVLRYVVGAYLALLNWWLDVEPVLSPEEADRIFQTLVAPGIRTVTRPGVTHARPARAAPL
jgi:AcrR family transcriptional regulator